VKAIAAILSIPTIAGFIWWALSYSVNPSPDKIDQAGQLIAQAAIPWWVSVIQFLAPLGFIGAIGILVLLFLISKKG
jgi:hypothetical protein